MDPESQEPAPGWLKMATVVVYLLLIAAFAYIFMSYMTQRNHFELMNRLVEGNAQERAAVIKTLKESDAALPNVCSGLINGMLPETRLACADIILARLEERLPEVQEIGEEAGRQAEMRSGLDMYSVCRALMDENPEVRAKARKIVEMTGTEATYQQALWNDSLRFEDMLGRLMSDNEKISEKAAEDFRLAGERGLNFLVGTVFDKNPAQRLRGMRTLHTVIQDILRGSNQKRVVPVLGRRRCQLLIAEMVDMKPDNRKLVQDILDVSGRIGAAYFDRMIAALKDEPRPIPAAATRPWVVGGEGIEGIEELEKTRGAEVPAEKIQKSSQETK